MLNFSNKPASDYPISENSANGNSLKDNRFSNKPNGDSNIPGNSSFEAMNPVSVHAMPGKFLPSKPSKGSGSGHGSSSNSSSGSGRKILVFVGVFLFLAIAILAGAYWYLNLPKVPETPNVNQPVVANQNTNQNQNQNTNANVNQNQNSNVVSNDNLNTNINENSNDAPVLPLVESPDSDNDLLSYEEEQIFGTNSSLDDSDKDGYKDGAEISNLYNPLVPAQSLADSGLVTKFVNSSFSYSIMRPSAWLVSSLEEDLGNIVILPDSESGEFFTISVRANLNNWSLNQAKDNLVDIFGSDSFMQNYSLGKEPALRSIDQKKVLMVSKDYVYAIVYESASLPKGNFKTIFQMMLNSFELTQND